MTKEQIKACEKLAINFINKEIDLGHLTDAENKSLQEIYKEGFAASQSPEMLLLNPLVKELVRVIGMVTHVGSPYDKIINEALAPFKKEG